MPSPLHYLTQQTGAVGGLVGLLNSADFVLPLADLGAGAVDQSLGRGVAPATFVRATTAWTKLSTGLWASVATGTARSFYSGLNTAVGTYAGYLAEGQRTNSCLQARDLSTTWTATTATLAKDQVGIDGVTNSASSLLATAGNGQATQAIVLASAAKTFSVFIKRITGTGTVQISLDNFATNTDVTASINSTTYTQVSMTQTLANPTVGIRLVTSTDKIAVDMCQHEDGASFASTPIPTTTVAVTRNTDVLSYVSSGNASDAEGTAYAEFLLIGDATGNKRVVSSNTAQAEITLGSSTAVQIFDGTTSTNSNAVASITNGALHKASSSWSVTANKQIISLDGGIGAQDVYDGTIVGTAIHIGEANTGNNLFGTVRNLRFWTRALSNAQLQAMTT